MISIKFTISIVKCGKIKSDNFAQNLLFDTKNLNQFTEFIMTTLTHI